MNAISTNITQAPIRSWISGDNVVQVFPVGDVPLPTTSSWLFFRRSYLVSGTSDLIYSFILTSKYSPGILALFHCAPVSETWISHPKAPFGGIFPAPECRIQPLTFLLQCVREWVNSQGGSTLTIKTPPSCYAPLRHELCHRAYLDSGFLPNHSYSNHYIPIGRYHFAYTIEPAERRRLAKGKMRGLHVSLETGIPDHFVSGFLQQCHRAHSYETRALEQETICMSNAGSYVSLICWLEKQPVAAAIMVWVSDDILYHFRSGYLPAFRTLSPSLLLFEAAFNQCREKGGRLLDLGISVDHHGIPKPSLAGFKSRMGAIECKKIIYQAIC